MTETSSKQNESWLSWAARSVIATLEDLWTALETIGQSAEITPTRENLTSAQTVMQMETLKLICDYCDTQNATTAQSCIACGAGLPKIATDIAPKI